MIMNVLSVIAAIVVIMCIAEVGAYAKKIHAEMVELRKDLSELHGDIREIVERI